MANGKTPLLAFNRGVISPGALGRVDIESLRWAAELQTNFIGHQIGSMSLRPGFGYLLNTSDSRPKYLPFVFGVDDVGLLELTDGQLRPIFDDAALEFDAVTAAVTNGDMTPDIANWTDADDSGATSEYSATAGALVALSSRTVYDVKDSGIATAKFKLDGDGLVYTMRNYYDSGTYQAAVGEWLLSGAAADYEHRATILSGTLTSGTTGTWLGGGTDREFVKSVSATGTDEVVLLVETRLTNTTATLAQAEITLKGTVHIGGGGGISP